MKLSTAWMLVLFFSFEVSASDYAQGLNAYNRGIYIEARNTFSKLAEKGHVPSQNNMGIMYRYGQGVEKNYSEAVKWFQLAAGQNSPVAQFNLGAMYESGMGVKADLSEARRFFYLAHTNPAATAETKKAAQSRLEILGKNLVATPSTIQCEKHQDCAGEAYCNSNSICQKSTATRSPDEEYQVGVSAFTKRDFAEAWRVLLPLAKQNHIMAQGFVGNMYKNGLGIDKNTAEAMQWYRRAADQNHPDAQNFLGSVYAAGDGVAQNYREAIYWYQKASVQNHADATVRLGALYFKGLGVERNEETAFKLFSRAAAQGEPTAQFNLGLMYQNGRGVKVDYGEARRWYGLAERNMKAGQETKAESRRRVAALQSNESSRSGSDLTESGDGALSALFGILKAGVDGYSARKSSDESDNSALSNRFDSQPNSGAMANSKCSSDFDCSHGQRCIKPPYESGGSCLKEVNAQGIPTHVTPSGDSVNRRYQGCKGNWECPSGFSCDSTLKACVRK